MEIKLNKDERIDDLEINNLKIIQNSNNFCFGVDAVLLSDFAKNIKENNIVMDLGTGNGIIPILLSAKTSARKIIGIEIQQEVYELAKRNLKLNNIEDRIEIVNTNIKELVNIYPSKSINVIVTNPPYKELGRGIVNETDNKLISRHEVEANLEDFIRVTSHLLKDKGEIYMVHKPERLVDIFCLMRKYKIEPKGLKYVFPNVSKQPSLILVKGVKCGKSFLNVEENIYIYEENGEYTSQLLEIYNKKKE